MHAEWALLEPAWGASACVGRAFVSVEKEEGGKSRGEEEREVTQVMKDQEGADACLESDIAGPYRRRRTPSSKKLHFL